MSRAKQALVEHRDEVIALANRYHLGRVRVFGSVARDADDNQSDLDLLVEPADDVSLLPIGGFLMDVRYLLGMRVDVGLKEC